MYELHVIIFVNHNIRVDQRIKKALHSLHLIRFCWIEIQNGVFQYRYANWITIFEHNLKQKNFHFIRSFSSSIFFLFLSHLIDMFR